MRQWEVHKFPLPVAEQPHYFVVLSPDLVAAELRDGPVNLLMCRTLRPADRALKPTEILLDEADGFSRKTVVDCLSIYQAAKSLARDPLGSVSPTRRRAIARKVIDCFRLQVAWSPPAKPSVTPAGYLPTVKLQRVSARVPLTLPEMMTV